MKISDTNWMMIEEYLKHDDRVVVPIGCTEQHAYLSLAVDAILAENVAVEAAEPLGVPVFPVIPFGHTPTFMAYPGTISLRLLEVSRANREQANSQVAAARAEVVRAQEQQGGSEADSQESSGQESSGQKGFGQKGSGQESTSKEGSLNQPAGDPLRPQQLSRRCRPQ